MHLIRYKCLPCSLYAIEACPVTTRSSADADKPAQRHARPSYCVFSIFIKRPSAILDFHIFAIFVKNPNLRLDLHRQAKFGEDKIGLCAGELLRIFEFQNDGRPPSCIGYDVIADHSRLVFDGPNILLKLHVDHVYILRDIAIFTARCR